MPAINFGVRTPVRLLRLKLDDGQTIKDVKAEVAKDTSVDASQWTISLTQNGDTPIPDSTKLSSLGIANKLIFGVLPAGVTAPLPGAGTAAAAPAAAGAASTGAGATAGGAGTAAAAAVGGAASPTPKPAPRKLTDKCKHGPHGACQYCCGATVEEMAAHKADGTLNRTTVDRHKDRSSKASELTGDMEWMCKHRPDQMCINCAPLKKGEAVHLEMLCQHGPDARCINCLPPDTVVEGRKALSYGEWLEHSKDKCSHTFSAVCVNCMPPADARYSLKPGCTKHRPWPYGICLDCSPEDVYLKPQPYRHVDHITMIATNDFRSMVDLVSINERSNVQRAALLFGVYSPDASFRHGTRAVVQASYEPPQVYDFASGAVTLLPDPKEALVQAVAKAAGLQPIGWMYTRRDTSKSKKVALLPHELYAMAAAQMKHSPRATDGRPGSQWVTVAITKDADTGMYEPHGHMASDQLMAVVRDNVIAPPKNTDTEFARRVMRKGTDDLPVPEIIQTDTLRGRFRSETFIPEYTMVSMQVAAPTEIAAPPAPAGAAGAASAGAASAGAASSSSSSGSAAAGGADGVKYASGSTDAIIAEMRAKNRPLFSYADFPRANREMFGVTQDGAALKRYLTEHAGVPWEKRLADFNLIIFLGSILDAASAELVAKAIATGTPVPEGVVLIVEELSRAL